MAMSTDAVQLANFLAVLTQPDTEAIRQAELALKPLLKDPRCVPALVEILKSKETQVSSSSSSHNSQIAEQVNGRNRRQRKA